MASDKNICALILIVLGSAEVLSTSNDTEWVEITQFPRIFEDDLVDVVMGVVTCLNESAINICTDHVPTLNVFLCTEPTEYSESVDEFLDLRDYFDEFLLIRDSIPDAHEKLSRLADECIQTSTISKHPWVCNSVEIASVALHQNGIVDVNYLVGKCYVDRVNGSLK
ncbi:hypothetical protein RF11_04166 [Thelohanellus kitauei]|uniref:Uncharacterized protein n=1 Tax=Thelohanellus kitauei TaxID=669202 RepID=A0A0C2IN33_THEKT|nr:hypothetical protein RF11_04166 [Thelohanellus kitauei]